MNRRDFTNGAYTVLLSVLLVNGASAADREPLKVLLVGDSTTIGGTPRLIDSDGPHLETMIEQLAEVEGLPTLKVINAGKGGETAK